MHNDAVNAVLLSPGKTLTDPLLILVLAAVLFLVLARRRARHDQSLRRLLGWALASLLLLGILATGAVARLLEWTLLPSPSRQPPTANRQPPAPEVIVVASGGSLPGPSPELDVLSESSETRIVTAAAWWRQHPAARLIITGADRTPGGSSTRTLEMMRETALRLGVPPAAITIEAQSFDTREHALRIAALPGMTRSTRIGLVTSAWHMRRTRRAFARHFTTVIPHAAVGRPQPLIVNDVIPSSLALRTTTRMLHEWLGIAWYALRR